LFPFPPDKPTKERPILRVSNSDPRRVSRLTSLAYRSLSFPLGSGAQDFCAIFFFFQRFFDFFLLAADSHFFKAFRVLSYDPKFFPPLPNSCSSLSPFRCLPAVYFLLLRALPFDCVPLPPRLDTHWILPYHIEDARTVLSESNFALGHPRSPPFIVFHFENRQVSNPEFFFELLPLSCPNGDLDQPNLSGIFLFQLLFLCAHYGPIASTLPPNIPSHYPLYLPSFEKFGCDLAFDVSSPSPFIIFLSSPICTLTILRVFLISVSSIRSAFPL